MATALRTVTGRKAEQEELIALVNGLGREKFAPRAEKYDREASFPFENYDDLRAAGLLGLCVPKAHGGMGADFETYCLVAAEMGRWCGATALTFNMHACSALWAGPLADDLDIEFTLSTFNHRVERMKEILVNRDMLLGLGDGGAHVDMLCDAGYPTFVLGTWVREQGAITLEEGVRRLTSDPADFFGLRDRGRLAPGMAADIAIFDPATVGSGNRGERRYDLPGGAKRMVMPSRGVIHTIVNGESLYEHGQLTEARAGQVLRG